MANPVGFIVPKKDVETLIDIFKLPQQTKENLFTGLSSYSGELTRRSITEHLLGITGLNHKVLMDITDVFLGFTHSQNAFTSDNESFVEQVRLSINESFPDHDVTESDRKDILSLMTSGKSSQRRIKLLSLATEDANHFDEAKIIQNLRTSFDNDGNIEGSVIVHSLKISTFGKNNKEYFISMTSKGLEELIDELKKAQENHKRLESAFDNAELFEP